MFFSEKIEKNVQKLFKNILSKKYFQMKFQKSLKFLSKRISQNFQKGSEIIQKEISLRKFQKSFKNSFQKYFSKNFQNFSKFSFPK